MELLTFFSNKKWIAAAKVAGIYAGFWVLQALMDWRLFNTLSFSRALWVPTGYQLWLRLLVLFGISAFSIYQHRCCAERESIIKKSLAAEDRYCRMEESLRTNEQELRSLVEITSDWIWEVDARGRYTYSSPMVEEILGYTPEEIIGKTPFDFMPPEERVRVGKLFGELMRSKGPILFLDNINMHKNGFERVLETSGIPLLDHQGRLTGYRGIDRDITGRVNIERRLKKSLKEKDILLQEVHHRVKNNLQIVSSLLALQLSFSDDERIIEALTESTSRIQAMALVHQELYSGENLEMVDLKPYIERLVDYLQNLKTAEFSIDYDTRLVPCSVSMEKAISVALVLNEIFINAIKHLPKPDNTIFVRNCTDGVTITIETGSLNANGHEIEEEAPYAGLGSEIIAGLIEQLDGKICVLPEEGYRYVFSFPV